MGGFYRSADPFCVQRLLPCSPVTKGRLEAFSDGVIAILITIMVLELHPPEGTELATLRPLLPVLLTYLLSYVYLGIYWNNHHHMLQACERIDGRSLWANLHLLFWLSLIPFVTGWMGRNHFAPVPTALYGVVLFFAGVAYYILAHVLVAAQGPDSRLARAIGNDRKGRISILMYAVASLLAFVNQWIADAIYVTVALIWLVPDRRIESRASHAARSS
jgi:uncharacterized membrane protein